MPKPTRQLSSPLLAALLWLAGPTLPAQSHDEPTRSVTVSASGEAEAEPDLARVSAGITTEAPTAREALAKNSEAMEALIDGLKKLGIDAKDIQTSQLSLDPRYTSPRDGQPPVIDGYRATNQVTVTARDLGRLGELLDSLVGIGANQMGGLSFEVSRAEELRDTARKAAIANARRRAELFATAAGASVGEVIAIAEDAPIFQPQPMAMQRMSESRPVPIERGSQRLEARVTVTWALK